MASSQLEAPLGVVAYTYVDQIGLPVGVLLQGVLFERHLMHHPFQERLGWLTSLSPWT